MVTNLPARAAIALAVAAVLATPAGVSSHPARFVVESGTAESLDPGNLLRVAGPGTMAAHVEARATLDAESAAFLHEGGGARSRRAYGVFISDGGGFSLAGGHVGVRGPWGIGVQAQGKARVDLTEALVEVSGDSGIGIMARREAHVAADGVRLRADGRHSVALLVTRDSGVSAIRSHVLANSEGATALSIDSGQTVLRHSVLEGTRGYAIRTPGQGGGTAVIRLEHSHVSGRVESGAADLSIHATGGRIDGDIVRAGTGALALSFVDSAWHGRAERVTALSLRGATWALAGDSDIGAVRLERGARIDVGGGRPDFRTLRVGAWHAEPGAGGIVLATRLGAGGKLRRQATDRLLVSGDVVGQTLLHVANAGGMGAATAGRRGENGPGDGISVVQVGGAANAESFRLASDYVAIGPWQYRLNAYAPGATDPAQRLVDGTGGYWDYRLQSVRSGTRAALVPQVPAYLVLGHALFGYGRIAIDALHAADAPLPDPPALRVHAFGGAVMYRSGAQPIAYGIDYRRADRGLQVAGDLLVHRIGDTTLRTGFAVSSGTTRATPQDADGRSDLRAAARGVGWHATLVAEGGWTVASSFMHTLYRVDVHTPSRGQVLPRMRSTADEAMVSSALRWRPVSRVLVEPHASILWQRLRAARMRDGDGIDLSIGAPRRVTLRAGARASVSFRAEGRRLRAWSPYLDVRYGIARDSGARVRPSGERLPAARAGRAVEVATGVLTELGSRWTARADASFVMGGGRGAERGGNARLGVAKAF